MIDPYSPHRLSSEEKIVVSDGVLKVVSLADGEGFRRGGRKVSCV